MGIICSFIYQSNLNGGGMQSSSKSNSTTLRLTGARKDIATTIALNISNKCGRIVKVSEIINFILDRHLNNEALEQITQEFIKKEEVK